MPLLSAGSLAGHSWEQPVLPARWHGRLLNLCNTACHEGLRQPRRGPSRQFPERHQAVVADSCEMLSGQRVLVAVGEYHYVRSPHRQVAGNLACRIGRNRRDSSRVSGEMTLKRTVNRAKRRPVTFGRNKYIGIVDAYDQIEAGALASSLRGPRPLRQT
jgi:hypothetical protein